MIKKILLLTIGYLFLLVAGIVIQSCTPKPYDAKICDASLYGYNSISVEGPDYFDEMIGFRLDSQNGNSMCCAPSFSLITPALALQSCANWQNYFLLNSLTLSFDRMIIYQSDTIGENIDLLSISDINSQIEIEEIQDCDIYSLSMLFTQELSDELQFLDGEYEAKVTCQSSDGINFNRRRLVVFNQ